MEHAYSIFMLIFTGAILIYAGLLALTKDYNMLPYHSRVSVKPKDPKRYTRQLAKVVALVALAPALSAIVGFWSLTAAFIVLIVGAVIFIWLGTKLMKDVN